MKKTTSDGLTEADILAWVGEASLKRARSYFRDGSILNPRRQGRLLKAQCLGSLPEPYRVEVALGEAGIARGECSCPVGVGGRCKHAAALLLTWLDDAEGFAEVEEVGLALNRRAKSELVELIVSMIARHADLEDLLELPTVSARGKSKPLDPKVIERQAKKAIDGAGHEWGAAREVAQALSRLVELGDGYARSGNLRDARTVYQVVVRETLEGYETLDDQEGDLHAVVNACVAGLGMCLAEAEDAARRDILRSLFEVYRWDVEFGGISMGDDACELILEQASPAEKKSIAGWVREAMPPVGSSWSGNYHRQSFGGFLLELGGDDLNDETFLRVCRESGRVRDLVQRLLDLKREDEATAEAAKAEDYDLLQLADLFVARGLANRAERLIRERAKTSQDHRLNEWLKGRAKERGDTAEALTLAETLFRERPTVAGYREAAEFAAHLKQREAVRKRLLDPLVKRGEFALLTEIHLEDGEIDQALETLKKVKTASWGWTGESLALKVARKAERRRPKESIDLYMKEVERLIALQGRANYTTAASHLVRVRDVFRRIGEGAAFEAMIDDLRKKNTRLRAFREELDAAGL